MKHPYKGDWRVKEYKPYVEQLEEDNARLEERITVLLGIIGYQEMEKVNAPIPTTPLRCSADEWGHTSTNLWP